jgi:hypothetical protein
MSAADSSVPGVNRARRWGWAALVLGLAVAAAACSPANHSAASSSTVGQQTTLPRTTGYTCHDPLGDISLDPSAAGRLTQPAGIDIVEASALVEGDVLAVSFTTNGPIAAVPQPLFDVQQGDPSTAPDLSFELRAQPATITDSAGPWNVVLHTFKGGNEAKTDLAVPVTVDGSTLSYEVPLSQIPAVVSLQWEFGTSSVQADNSVPYDDCSSFTAEATTTTG